MSTQFKRWREAQGLTQEEAAERLGPVRGRTVQNWEAGTRQPSGAVRMVMWAIAQGIELEPWPLDEDEQPRPRRHKAQGAPTDDTAPKPRR